MRRFMSHRPKADVDEEYGRSDSLAAIRVTPGAGAAGGELQRGMSKRLGFVLLTAALAAATLVGFSVPATPANAELRTVTVRLADGSLTTVTVDVPPGTPLDQVQLPAPPPTPSVTTPIPVPNPTSPGSPAPSPSPNPSNPTGGGQGQQPGDVTKTPDQIPNASGK